MPTFACFLLLLLHAHIAVTVDWEQLEEVQAAGEAAVISVGMVYALDAAPEIARYLENHPEYAEEFRTFGRNAVEIAHKHLGNRLGRDLDKIILYFVIAYGLQTYDIPVYVGPGSDPDTEELRVVFRMLNHLSAAVPEDPKKGGELLVLSLAFARHLQVLSAVAKDNIPYDEELLNQVRHHNAHFRLSFRLPHKMHFYDAERETVVDHFKMAIEEIRQGVEAGTHPSSSLKSILDAKQKILDRERAKKEHGEL